MPHQQPSTAREPSLSGTAVKGEPSYTLYGAFDAPETVIETPDILLAIEAERSLTLANEENKAAGQRIVGLSLSQGETLLKWMINQARVRLLTLNNIELGSEAAEHFFLNPKNVRDMCGDVEDMIATQAHMLGLECLSHELPNIPGRLYTDHAFSVVNIPLRQANGHIAQKSYLVDVTFKQFFEHEEGFYHYIKGCVHHTNIWDNKVVCHTLWGAQITKTEAGRKVAYHLLRDGFIELTPEVARIYFSSIQKDAATGQHVEIIDPNLMQRLSANTLENHYISKRNKGIYTKVFSTPSQAASLQSSAHSLVVRLPAAVSETRYPAIELHR